MPCSAHPAHSDAASRALIILDSSGIAVRHCTAGNSHVLAFDNLSGLPPWLSDTLCRLTSGGAFSTRRLFTDQDEILFAAARPIILNGIEEVITRPHARCQVSCRDR